MIKISDSGIKFIASFEGIKLNAYLDPIGIPTIGIGTIRYPGGNKVKMGDKITLDQAYEYLRFDVNEFSLGIDKVIKVPLTQNQQDAIISFTYNLGLGNLKSSTLLKKINSKAPCNEIQAEFKKWDKANNKVLAGLTRRRLQESELFCK